ncbi:competence protein ComGF [Solibacillus sp. MA9]|uniref:Competence protein ComGF n=1 Tax=Solibacillus palustris TaxID=2908203 RepID=A0ABS9UBL7_9BACL|nr:competence type IV pilus minor pilin ComGF [Solibacillus sp. MA9]MCH7321741.1 competence protein ComGF [Solibacillus sp. MA9]
MYLISKIKNQRGFTLLESLFHLAVLVLFASISLLIVIWVRDIQNINQIKHDVNWELFVYDVHQYNENSISGEIVSPKILMLEPANDPDNREFYIEQPNNHVRKRSNKGGNEIMLPNVQGLQYRQEGNEIIMKVVTQDGKLRERVIVMPLPRE